MNNIIISYVCPDFTFYYKEEIMIMIIDSSTRFIFLMKKIM